MSAVLLPNQASSRCRTWSGLVYTYCRLLPWCCPGALVLRLAVQRGSHHASLSQQPDKQRTKRGTVATLCHRHLQQHCTPCMLQDAGGSLLLLGGCVMCIGWGTTWLLAAVWLVF
jgi:hypothetical protein